MKKIEEISNRIEEELEDAEHYAMLSLEEDDKQLAEVYHRLSIQEIDHSNILHNEGVRLIEEYKAQGNDLPVGMKAVYDHLHRKHIEKATKVKSLQDQYK